MALRKAHELILWGSQ